MLPQPRHESFFHVVRHAEARRGVALMGVCNVTPDSFSDGGEFLSKESAFARVDALLREGADILDIGGESTRPRSKPVSPREQLERIAEVVAYAAKRGCVSIDTTDADVASAGLAEGAMAINDVSCLADGGLARVARDQKAALIIMHSRGSQETMRGFSTYPEDAYKDIVHEVISEWRAALSRATGEGVVPEALYMDPGLGFAKNARQSATLLRETARLKAELSIPIVIGASRKSFLALVDADAGPRERLGASIGAALVARDAGASIVRVHDVRETRQALDGVRYFGKGGGRETEGGAAR